MKKGGRGRDVKKENAILAGKNRLRIYYGEKKKGEKKEEERT